jgi:hypothetical protein
VVNAEIGSVRAKLLGRDGQIDGLQKRVGCRARPRLRRGHPVPKREETYLFHEAPSLTILRIGGQAATAEGFCSLSEDAISIVQVQFLAAANIPKDGP